MSISEVRKLRLRECKQLAQGHTAKCIATKIKSRAFQILKPTFKCTTGYSVKGQGLDQIIDSQECQISEFRSYPVGDRESAWGCKSGSDKVSNCENGTLSKTGENLKARRPIRRLKHSSGKR